MSRPALPTLICVLLTAVQATQLLAQNRSERQGRPGPSLVEPAKGRRIAWFSTLEGGRAEAKRTGKPILFLSAAPHCGTTPGVW